MSIKKNYAYSFAYDILIIVLPLITTPYVSRVLGADGVGTFSYSRTIAEYFGLAAMLGMKNHGSRVIAAVRDQQLELNQKFTALYSFQLLAGLSSLAVYIVYALCLEGVSRTYALLQMTYVAASIFDINWFYFGLEKFQLTVTRNFIVKLLTVILIFLTIKGKNDLWKYMLIMGGGTFISQTLVWLFLPRYASFIRVQKKEITTHVRSLFILFIPVAAVSVYKMLSKVILGMMTAPSEVAYYEYADKLQQIPLLAITSLSTVMLPRISHLLAKNEIEKTRSYFYKTLQFAIRLSFPLSLGLISVAPCCVPVIWGEEFRGTIEPAMVLASSIPFVVVANVVRVQYLIPAHRDKLYVISVCCGAGMNIVLNILLIPAMKAIGAALATLTAEITVCMIQVIAIRKELKVGKVVKHNLIYLLFALAMGFVVYTLGNIVKTSLSSIVLQIGAGILVFGILAVTYMLLVKDELLQELTQKWLRRKG